MPNHTPPQLFLVDGYALIYRAFFAMMSRPLRTTRGENTSAAWGVVNFLLRLQEKYRPDYLAWVLDAGTSFRAERYPDYKSTREKLGDELQADFDRAVERTRELLEAFRVTCSQIPGYEADDVIGTLAVKAADQGIQAVIVSGDKDFYQLIGPRVALLNPGRGGPGGVDETWVDETNATARLGVPPAQVTDFLALVGDTSDNVPGVKGVGEKGAQKLLADFGDLETLLVRAAEVPAKRAREALMQYAAEARLSRELVTIRRDVPVELELERLAVAEPDRERLLRLLTELEFYTLVRKVSGTPEADAGPSAPAVEARPAPLEPAFDQPAPAVSVTVVDSPGGLPDVVARLRRAELLALDAVASSSRPRQAELVGLSLAASPSEVWYFPFAHRPRDGELAAPSPVTNLPPLAGPDCGLLAELLRDPEVPKAGHNLKFDWQVLRGAGVELGGVAYDSMLASFVLDPGRRSHALDTLALEHLGRTMETYPEAPGRGKKQIPVAELPVQRAADLCGTDSAVVLALHDFFAPRLRDTSLEPLLRDLELPLIEVLAQMEWDGIGVDRAVFQQLSRELGADLFRLEGEITRAAGVELNLNSPRQLATVLFEKHQLPVQKKTKTGPSTDADVLEQLAAMGHELPRLILEYRELQKLKSTYVDALPLEVNPKTGRIHTSFNQTGAATGRLSSSDPNLQNIPIRTARGEAIRRGFIPCSGAVFLVADYSQIELRIMAHLSGDSVFIEAFRQGGDIHRQTAALIFGVSVERVTPEMRARAKTINFATIYGQGPFALSRQLGISQEDAKAFIARYFQRFAGVRAFLDRQVQLAREQGYVETLFKRRRYIPEIRDRNFNMRAYAERTAQNSPLQGSAADLIKLAMVRTHRAIRQRELRSRMLLQVHDELLFEVPVAEVEEMRDLVRRQMETVVPLDVALVVDIGVGPNWRDAKA
jgi:DNA polymerase I